jgi:hypothetical protein
MLKIQMLIIAALLAACSGSEVRSADGQLRIGDRSVVAIDGDALEFGSDSVAGKGSFVFQSPLGAIDSNVNFRFVVTLQEGASIELRSHADGKLGKGVAIRLQRDATNIVVSLAAGGKESNDFPLPGGDVTQPLALSVDVHNSETPAHVLIWPGDLALPNDDNAWFNSDADAQTPGNGGGNFWGFAMQGGALSEIAVEEAAFGH